MLVEQAVYTSARTSRLNGYQLVTASSGISESDAKELSRWGPAHDALREEAATAASINFFPLGNGNFCVSRTTLAGSEYSGRGGGLVYTQCFKVSAELMLRFANNPVRVIEAILAAGRCREQIPFPSQLEPFRLVGRAKPVDAQLLTGLALEPGPAAMGVAANAIASDIGTCLVTPCPPLRIVGGLLNLLPIACRTELSFTTGLAYSPRRPFRLHFQPEISRSEVLAFQRAGMQVVHLHDDSDVESIDTGSWGDLVQRTLATESITVWESLLQHCEACESPEDLNIAAEACMAVLLN